MPLIAPTYIPGTYPSVNNPIENAALTFQESWACLRADRPPPFDPDSTSSVPPTTLLFHATRRHHLACMRTNDSFSILDNSSRHDLTAAGTSGVYLLNSFANAVAQVLRYQHAPSTVDDTVAVIVFEVETDVLLRKEVAKKLGAKFKTKVFDVPTAPEEVGYAEKYQEFCEFVGANWDPYSGWTKAGWTEEEDNDFLVAPLSLTPLKTDVGMDVNLNPDGPRLVQVAPRSYMAKQYLKEWMTEIVVERRTTEP
ncbi:hypothetical protein DFH06DRAFT_206427 [Mycena polygramma]|nr:hypothetical protein DFH06DRAFT_206427 [Mycena polygramma]